MQRKPTTVNFTMTLHCKRHHHEPESIACMDNHTPDDFKKNFNYLFEEKNSLLEMYKRDFPRPVITVEISGTMNDRPIETKTFAKMEELREYLNRHRLLPTAPVTPPAKRLHF